MRQPLVAFIGLALAIAVVQPLERGVFAQTRGTVKPGTVSRTPDGHPDLQGNWSFATITPLERPGNVADKAVLTAQEVEEIEKQAAARADQDDGRQRGTAADVSRAYNDFWYDRGTKVVGTRQTSIVVDPPNGRVPPLTADGQARAAARAAERRQRGPADGPEDRSLAERCLVFNAGPPLGPGPYNNNVQIVQTHDYVVIETEMVHESRIVPLDGRPHLPATVRPWMGDSRGHWEGDTLVVETTNFNAKNLYRGASENLRLVERFSRSAEGVLMYEFTVNDPATWTLPWTGRMSLDHVDGQLYEYACHEANYGMTGILKGARADEASAAAGATR